MGQHRGGIRGLWRLVEDYAEPLEADLLQYYGLDLADLFRPGSRLTWRRLAVLVRQLPPTSRTAAAQAGHDVWSGERHLLADLVDLGQNMCYLLGVVATKDHTFKRPPVGLPQATRRPGMPEVAETAARITPDEFARWFAMEPGLGASG